jgi:serine protease Do
MRSVVIWFIVVASFASGLPHKFANAGEPVTNWSDIAQQVVPAIVNLWVERISRSDDSIITEQRKTYSGSGFIVDPSGEIVTNKHLIEGAFSIIVTLKDGTELPAKLLAAAAIADIAVLKVQADRSLPSLKLANADMARIGDPVLAVGNPLGIGTSLSAGIISALNRDLRDSPMDDYIQTDAAINYGNSGSPLIDIHGEVVGLNTALVTTTKDEGSMGLGFAISSSVLTHVLRHLRDRSPLGWIGTHVQDMTPDLANAFGVRAAAGFIVTAVDANSPADEVGLRSGDIILRFGREMPPDARALMREIGRTPVGTRVDLLVWQSGHERTIATVVRAWPNLVQLSGATLAGKDAQLPTQSPDLGMLLAPITDAARKRYALGDAQGVAVVAVDNESEAFSKGITPGDVIEKVQNTAINAPRDFLRLVQEAASQNEAVALLVRRKAARPDGSRRGDGIATAPELRWIVLHADSGRLVGRLDQSPLQAPHKPSRMSGRADADGEARD